MGRSYPKEQVQTLYGKSRFVIRSHRRRPGAPPIPVPDRCPPARPLRRQKSADTTHTEPERLAGQIQALPHKTRFNERMPVAARRAGRVGRETRPVDRQHEHHRSIASHLLVQGGRAHPTLGIGAQRPHRLQLPCRRIPAPRGCFQAFDRQAQGAKAHGRADTCRRAGGRLQQRVQRRSRQRMAAKAPTQTAGCDQRQRIATDRHRRHGVDRPLRRPPQRGGLVQGPGDADAHIVRHRRRQPGRGKLAQLHRPRVQQDLGQHALLALIHLQQPGQNRFIERARQRRARAQRGGHLTEVFQRMAQIGQHVAQAAVAVFLPGAPPDGGGDHRSLGLGRQQRRIGRGLRADAGQPVALGPVVPHARCQAGKRPDRDIELGREQRPGRRRRAQGNARRFGADAGGMPQQGGQALQAEQVAIGRGPRRRRQRHHGHVRRLRRFERWWGQPPVQARRPADQAGAGMGRMRVKRLDQGQAVGGSVRTSPANEQRHLGAPVAQPQQVAQTQRARQAQCAEAAHQRVTANTLRRRVRRDRRGWRRRAQVPPQGPGIEGQMHGQHDQQNIPRQVVPVENRQMLVGNPEQPQPGGQQQVQQQHNAEHRVELRPRRQTPTPRTPAHPAKRQESGGKNPELLAHGT